MDTASIPASGVNTLPGIFQPFFSQFPIFHPVIDYINNFQFVVDETPLSSYFWGWGFPFIYLSIILGLKQIMKNRKPFEFKYLVALHNLVLMIASIIMFVGMLNAVIRRTLETGFYETWCAPSQFHLKGDGAFWEYVFYLSKFYELLDSLFLVLGKKKNLNFLHVYHHFIVVMLFWSYNKSYSFGHWMLILSNTWVHIFMYYYFAISTAFGWTVWWKRYLTIMQLIQFVFDLTGTWPLYPMRYLWDMNCSTEFWTINFGQFIGFTFLILFYDLYKQNYPSKKSSSPTSPSAGGKATKAKKEQ